MLSDEWRVEICNRSEQLDGSTSRLLAIRAINKLLDRFGPRPINRKARGADRVTPWGDVRHQALPAAGIAARDGFGRLTIELRAGLIGASVGILAWFAPDLVGGGDQITQRALIGFEGPAIVESSFTTVVIDPWATAARTAGAGLQVTF